jgi:hypothetical protein
MTAYQNHSMDLQDINLRLGKVVVAPHLIIDVNVLNLDKIDLAKQ